MRQRRRSAGVTLTPGVLTTAVSIGVVVLIVAITFVADWMQIPELSLSPQGQFLSPNGDGSYDIFTVSYRLADNARIIAQVYSNQNVVRTLANGQNESAGEHFLTWDGRNDIGSVVPDGFYRIEVIASGTMRSTSQSTQAQVDTQPPTVQLANIPEGMSVNTPALQIEGVTEPGAMISLNGTAQPQRVDNLGRFTFALKLLDGSNRIDLQAIDPAGNTTRVQRNILLVTEPPDITITRPLENEWTNQQIVTIEGSTRPGATLNINQQNVRFLRRKLNPAPFAAVFGDGFAQGWHPSGRGVTRLAGADGFDARPTDIFKGGIVWLADFKVDDGTPLRFELVGARQNLVRPFGLEVRCASCKGHRVSIKSKTSEI